jgi:hypothetical protein
LTILGEGSNHEIPHCGAFSIPSFSSLLGPNIRIRFLFSNTLSLHSSFNVRDHASQPLLYPVKIEARSRVFKQKRSSDLDLLFGCVV